MSKSLDRLKAINLRKNGISVNEIAKILKVSKSTSSLWTRHIPLSLDQKQILSQNSVNGATKGRIKGSQIQKQKRLDKIIFFEKEGENEFRNITPHQLLISGLALYWAEGSKKQRRVELCNSDPQMIKFFIHWLNKCYNIPITELSCYVGINQAHINRERFVIEFWSNQTGIPISQFTKTSFKKNSLKKIFENFNDHYGTLSVKVRKPARIFYKIIGQIYGLSHSC
jgi:predicted transcriptional regulator